MGTVTIVAFCGFRVSELCHFSMVRIEIRFGDLFMASSAFRHNLELEPLHIRTPDGVSRVAVIAHGQFLVRLANKRCVDALGELFLNTMMTLPAGRREVFGIHTRFGMAVRQFPVGCVAIRARRGHGQTAFQEALSMNAFCIPLDDFMFCPGIANGSFFSFSMTTRAEVGNVRGKCDRAGILFPFDRVSSVALLTCWTVGVVVYDKLTVHALLVLLADLGMTRGAIDLLNQSFAGPSMRNIDPGMTLTARCFRVHRVS